MYYLGVTAPLTNTFYLAIYICSLIWVGLIIVRLWRIPENILLNSLIVLLIAIHPYQAELFTFKSVPFYTSISLFLAFIGLYYSELKFKTIIWTSLFVAFALSIYQIFLNIISITICFSLIFEVFIQYRSNHSINWRKTIVETKLLPRLITTIGGVILYLAANKIVQYLLHITPTSRSQFISLHDISSRLAEVKALLIKVFTSPEPILPGALKILLFSLLLFAIIVSIEKIFSLRTNKNRLSSLVVFLVLLSAATLSIIGVILPMQDWWPVPRVLSAISIFWAGIVSLAYLNSGKLSRPMVVVLSSVVLFAFAGINNHIFTDQLRVNMRDFHKANRIIMRMENHPDFPKVKRVAIVGGSWAYLSPIYTAQSDMNISAFAPAWSKVEILNELSGYNFDRATPDEQKIAEGYCGKVSKWPDPDSVTINGGVFIVCLGN
jgi:hypothetical protein